MEVFLTMEPLLAFELFKVELFFYIETVFTLNWIV